MKIFNKIVCLFISIILCVNTSYALPNGGVVTSGNATISSNGTVTNINQSSNKASINWNSFSISKNETVNFNQPNSSSITLNRVIGNEKSIINGALNANGQVWILNSNGVLFGKDASINTSGLLASTKNITDRNFQAGNYKFTGNSTQSVINKGLVEVNNNGYVVFAANEVRNSGTIKAIKGKVHLVGANEVSINLNGNSLLNLTVNKGVLDAMVENSGAVYANGGSIYLTTNAVDELLKGVVNNTGVLEANSIDDLTGNVELFAHGGEVQVGGTIEAKDGFVETSGENLNVSSNTDIIANTWLLDPTNMVIESTGGSDLTGNSVSATAIESALATTNIELQADNNIAVNEDITWGTNKKLTLTADSINVNATIENTNTTNGGVYFNAENISDKVLFGTDGKVVINNVYQLQWMNRALDGNYVLGSDIDASSTDSNSSSYDSTTWGTAGWNPIGIITDKFTGVFDGLGHTVDGLYINRGSVKGIGLFGYTEEATIKNVGLENVSITGKDNIGALIGDTKHTIISNSYATGTLNGGLRTGGLVGFLNDNGQIIDSHTSVTTIGVSQVGGLVGYFRNGTISNSYATGSVTGGSLTGGLVGEIYNGQIIDSHSSSTINGNDYVGGLVGNIYSGTISNSNATGEVKGSGDYVGGLIGYFNDGIITNSNATGEVSGNFVVGGLAGYSSGSIENSYATGKVIGTNYYQGGLVGANVGTIKNSYATGNVNGYLAAGGLVGYNSNGTIENSYSTGNVTGIGYVGGLVGANTGTITNSFYDKDRSGQSLAVSSDYPGIQTNVQSLSTNQMAFGKIYKDASWDIKADSSITSSTPVIKYDSVNDKYYWAIAPVALTYNLNNKTVTYDGTIHNLNSSFTNPVFGSEYSSYINNSNYKFTVDGSEVIGYKNAGNYNNIKVKSDNEFFTISSSGNTDGKLTINKANVTVVANDKTRDYSDSNPSFDYSVTGLIGTDTLSGDLSTTATSTSVAGDYDITQGSLNNNNYEISFTKGTLTITGSAPTPPPSSGSTTANVETDTVKSVITPISNKTNVKNVEKKVDITLPVHRQSQKVVAKIEENKDTTVITLSELKQDINNGEVRVAESKNSSITLVESGVKLPKGVDQLFYVLNRQINQQELVLK